MVISKCLIDVVLLNLATETSGRSCISPKKPFVYTPFSTNCNPGKNGIKES